MKKIMQFDPSNKVVKLCAEGMALEAQGKNTEAHHLFDKAWKTATTDFEAFVAAHYMARTKKDPQEQLAWNQESLKRALLVPNDSAKGHFPSLYLNIGRSYENLGERKKAAEHYRKAADYISVLDNGPYNTLLRSGISEGLKRTGAPAFKHAELEALINSWCEHRELKPLSLVLPAYVGNLGTKADIHKLVSALSYLSATRCLHEHDQLATDKLIEELAGK